MGDGGQKRIALDSNKERFVRIKGFLYVKKAAFEEFVSFLQKKSFWFVKMGSF